MPDDMRAMGLLMTVAPADGAAIARLGHARAAPAGRMPLEQAAKVIFDVVIAFLLLVLLAPLMGLIAWAVRLDGGPALFAHRRLGRFGTTFDCLKFRTMVPDADAVLSETLARDARAAAEWAATHKLRDDPRVTRLGRLLRRTSLDELPQLVNVLRLEMSLVGPRPIVAAEISRYGTDFAYYCAVRPGLTGLWQVSGRNNTPYAEKVQLDARYVRSWTLWRDVLIMLRTVPAVVARRGAH